MHELKEARTELAELGEEAASAIRSETPLRSKFASWLLLCQTAMFLTVGLAFVGAGAAAHHPRRDGNVGRRGQRPSA